MHRTKATRNPIALVLTSLALYGASSARPAPGVQDSRQLRLLAMGLVSVVRVILQEAD